MRAVEIEKGIPVPPPRDRKTKYGVLQRMEIGDSVFYPDIKSASVNSALRHWRASTVKFRVAEVDDGVRVWRIA